MNFRNQTIEEKLGKEYTEHDVFERLETYISFYESLSFSIMNWVTQGTRAIINIDTYTYSSIQGTLESIKMILAKGRINDSYALLRKYYDVTIINIYTNLYLETKYSFDNFIVEDIDQWIKGNKSIPSYRVMSNFIKNEPSISDLTQLIYSDDRYVSIRKRCNENMHYNSYNHILLNDNEIYRLDRVKNLDVILKDLDNLFIQHFAFIFSVKEYYMMSSDYTDYKDMGMEAPDDSQYWVAPFIQKIFDDVIKVNRSDIAELMKQHISMEIE
jgi:3D (Asp-Asp-Asp) domain-containing protein